MTAHRSRPHLALVVAAALLLGLLTSAPAGADPPTLHSRVSGQGVAAGAIDPNTVFSVDDRVSWQPAYVASAAGPHFFDGCCNDADTDPDLDPEVPDSANWINCEPRFDACLKEDYSAVWYRTLVVMPEGVALSLTLRILADDFGTAYVNGVEVTGEFQTGTVAPVNPALLVAGVNTIEVKVKDTSGVQTGTRWEISGTFDPSNPDEDQDGQPDPVNNAPTVEVTGVADGEAYEIGDVPVAGCAAQDAEDGPTNPAPELSTITGPLADADLGSQTATCSVTDEGDVSATATATYTIVDTVDPTLSGAPTTGPNAAGWYSDPVTIEWTAEDSGSGLDPESVPTTTVLGADGTDQTATETVSDVAGNEASAISAPPVNIDRTDPVVAYSGGTAYGLLDTVSITCSASDGLSGLAEQDCPSASGPAWSFDPGSHELTASATDNAGNTASAETSFEVTATANSLCQLVHAFTTHHGTRTSLCAHLTNFERSRSRGQVRPAAAQLDAFRKEATSRTGKQLTAAEVAILIGWAATL